MLKKRINLSAKDINDSCSHIFNMSFHILPANTEQGGSTHNTMITCMSVDLKFILNDVKDKEPCPL